MFLVHLLSKRVNRGVFNRPAGAVSKAKRALFSVSCTEWPEHTAESIWSSLQGEKPPLNCLIFAPETELFCRQRPSPPLGTLKNRVSPRIAERASIAQPREPDNLRTFVSSPQSGVSGSTTILL
jgi:hypothetical protein